MNSIIKRFRNSLIFVVTVLLTSTATHIYAEDKGCWGDFFEESQYAGKHILIKGPSKLENLKQVEGEDWNQRIHSIKIGPKAKVTVYQNPRFELSLTDMAKKPEFMKAWGITEQDIKEDSELIFTGAEEIHDLGDFNFHKKVRSLKVECID
jgi:hypothetical protein